MSKKCIKVKECHIERGYDKYIEQLDSINAVSYTHLDVYKRQLCAFTMASKICAVAAATAHHTKGITIRQGEVPPVAIRTGRRKH